MSAGRASMAPVVCMPWAASLAVSSSAYGTARAAVLEPAAAILVGSSWRLHDAVERDAVEHDRIFVMGDLQCTQPGAIRRCAMRVLKAWIPLLGCDRFHPCRVRSIERSMLKERGTGLMKPTPEAARMHARRSAQNADHVTLVNFKFKVGRENRARFASPAERRSRAAAARTRLRCLVSVVPVILVKMRLERETSSDPGASITH